jgi:hypothetical protein
MALTMFIPALIKLNVSSVDYYLSDHNRSPVQQSYELIENSKRMADGTMRKYVTASKKSWSVSWEMLPGVSSQTVDGYLGAMALQNFYDANNNNPISLSFYSGSSTTPTQPKVITSQTPTVTTNVFISNFNCTVQKRLGGIDYWNVSMDFVEV